MNESQMFPVGTRVVLTDKWISGLESTLQRLRMESDCSHLRGLVLTVERVSVGRVRGSYWLTDGTNRVGAWYPKTSVKVAR